MRKCIYLLLLLLLLAQPVQGEEFTAPAPPGSAEAYMPENQEDFSLGLGEMLHGALERLRPDLIDAANTSLSLIAAVMLISILKTFPGFNGRTADLVGTAAISGSLLLTSDSLIVLGQNTVKEITEYGKLLLPVMTGALAAQGGVTKSTALYVGTAGFTAFLGAVISAVLIPGIYLFLALSTAFSALNQEVLKNLRDQLRSFISWTLKTVITVFTSYIGITGVISGTTDAAALKAARTTVSMVVPVVGNILSGASETMLLSVAVLKNTAGLYGIFAVLAIFLDPFLRILLHYWMLKLTFSVCSVFGTGSTVSLVGDFSSAMGLLLAMTGTCCLLLLIGTVCFMKGVG